MKLMASRAAVLAQSALSPATGALETAVADPKDVANEPARWRLRIGQLIWSPVSPDPLVEPNGVVQSLWYGPNPCRRGAGGAQVPAGGRGPMVRQPPRVLRVITRLNIGGPGRHLLELTRAMPEVPSVLACGRPPREEGELDASDLDPRVVPLVRRVSPVRDLRATWAVRRIIGAEAPDIVESHMAKAGLVARVAALTSRPRPAIVHVFHGHVLDGYFSKPVETAFARVERSLATRSDLLVTVSRQTKDRLLALGIGMPEQYRVVPLGIDLGPFAARSEPSGALRRSLGLGDETPLVGVAARLVPIKDHATLFSALAGLPGVHLAVLGDGPLRPRLEQQAAELGVIDRVHFTGWWLDMPAALSDCTVIALSSRNEGTPVSLIEAMAAGRPVVATRVGGTPEVVQDGEHGFLVGPGAPEELADRLRVLLGDPALVRTFGEQARHSAIERFGIERLRRDMLEIYSELLTGRRRSP